MQLDAERPHVDLRIFGFAGVIGKPYSLEELGDALRCTIEGSDSTTG